MAVAHAALIARLQRRCRCATASHGWGRLVADALLMLAVYTLVFRHVWAALGQWA